MNITATTARRRASRTEVPFKKAMQSIVYATGEGRTSAFADNLNKYAYTKLAKLGYTVRASEHQAIISWPRV